jgi:hypothetical protein
VCTLYPLHPTLYTLHPTPCTLHPTPYSPHPTPYTLHPIPYTLHPEPYTLHPTPYTLHPTPYTLHPTPYTGSGQGEGAADSVRPVASAPHKGARVNVQNHRIWQPQLLHTRFDIAIKTQLCSKFHC